MSNPFESPTPPSPEEGDEGFQKVMEIPEKEMGEATDMGGDSRPEQTGEMDSQYTEKVIRRPEKEGGDIILEPDSEKPSE